MFVDENRLVGNGESIVSPEVIFHAPAQPEPLKGFEGYKQILEMMHGAMPDIRWAAEEMIQHDVIPTPAR